MKKWLVFILLILSIGVLSCHRRTAPGRSGRVTVLSNGDPGNTKTEPGTTGKTTAPKAKPATPKVIMVNDNAAQKTVDGRYYYDLNGKRYWRSNKDGKYYLFNKSMYNNPDFKGNP